jgi:hypothetical protein
MAKLSLLEMTQNILSAMDSDEVNSITDTVESAQVAEIVKETYFDVFSTLDIPRLRSLMYLTPYNGAVNPTTMIIPDNVRKIYSIRYDYQENGVVGDYKDIRYIDPEDFLELSIQNGASGLSTQLDSNTLTYLHIRNDKNPQYWTSFNDWQIVFDSFDQSQETNLQQSRIQCWALLDLPWEHMDDYVPVIDSQMFPLLLSEAKSACFIALKQVSNAKEDQRAKRQWLHFQNDQYRSKAQQDENAFNRLPNYGRRR